MISNYNRALRTITAITAGAMKGDREAAIEAGTAAAAKLAAMAADDMRSEQEASMAIGYGIDAPDDEGRMADFRTVRGIR